MRIWIFLLLLAGAVARAQSTPRTLHVPADFPTIEAAISNASRLTVDTVLVAPGTYAESVSFQGKNVRLISSDGPADTFIMAPTGAAAVVFTNDETADSVLSGFTLTNSPSGILVSGTSPTIVSNVMVNCGNGVNGLLASPALLGNRIIGCHGTNGGPAGTAIYLSGNPTNLIEGNIIQNNDTGITVIGPTAAGSPRIDNNLISDNRGDAIDVQNAAAGIVQNLIVRNGGNGIHWFVAQGQRSPYVINNTVSDNAGAGVYADGFDAGVVVENNLVVGNPAAYANGASGNLPILEFNDIYSPFGAAFAGALTNLAGTAGNQSVDPWFACPPGGDYRLLAGSPCIDAGTNLTSILPASDFGGNSRIVAGTSNAPATVDLGAFEFNPTSPPVPCLYLVCPSNLVVLASPGQIFAPVSYQPPAAMPLATVTTMPASGAIFPSGTNLVRCTASYGTNTASCNFTVSVVVTLAITAQPQNTNVPAGQPLTLSVLATGFAPLNYSWLFAGTRIPGATNSTLTLFNPQSTNAGAYQVVVANSAGSVTSTVASVTVVPAPPQIVAGPSSVSLPAGADAAFTVTAQGTTPFAFQWFKDSSALSGAGAARLVVTNVQASDAGMYAVAVSNSLGTALSPPATLTVLPAPPTFVTQPVGGPAIASRNLTLIAVARGSEPIGYLWRQDGVPIEGATQSTLTLSNITAAAAGTYDVIATNAFGAATSAVAHVTVYPFSEQPHEWGLTINGYQDDFSGPTRNPGWVVVGAGGDHYLQTNGVLQVAVAYGDPNHLVYFPPGGYDTNTQEVLTRIRVVAFGVNDDPQRCGIAVGVTTNTSGLIKPWGAPVGLNLEFRDHASDINELGLQNQRKFKLLDDVRLWGPPGLEVTWMNNAWYWMRLRLAPLEDGTNSVFAKVWLADGQTPEPSDWQLRWGPNSFLSKLPNPLRSGYAGITACSGYGGINNGLAQFEVSYILIKANGLPPITAAWTPIGPPPNPSQFYNIRLTNQ
ncbi:MAG: immunoglobulin domain-containing protein [Verrucomicrobia bacterium]|nr:immunoglobulin domain-containing protein [Verrucomicrobiota bacterium]